MTNSVALPEMNEMRVFRHNVLQLLEDGMQNIQPLPATAVIMPSEAKAGILALTADDREETRTFLARAFLNIAIRLCGTDPVETWEGDEVVRARIWDKRLWRTPITFSMPFIEMLDWFTSISSIKTPESFDSHKENPLHGGEPNDSSPFDFSWNTMSRWVEPVGSAEILLSIVSLAGLLNGRNNPSDFRRSVLSDRKVPNTLVDLDDFILGHGKIEDIFNGILLNKENRNALLVLNERIEMETHYRELYRRMGSRREAVRISFERGRPDAAILLLIAMSRFARDPGFTRDNRVDYYRELSSDPSVCANYLESVGHELSALQLILDESDRIRALPHFDRTGPEKVFLRAVDRARESGDIDLIDARRRAYMGVIT